MSLVCSEPGEWLPMRLVRATLVARRRVLRSLAGHRWLSPAILCLALACQSFAFGQQPSTARTAADRAAFARANEEVVRLAPDLLDDLPSAVKADLATRGCTVPQLEDGAISNVIRGRFTRADRVDIALLCSRDRVSSILVFRGGTTEEVDEFGSRPDAVYIRRWWTGTIGYARYLGVPDPKMIREYHEAHGGPQPPRLTHDAIEDHYYATASRVWYWHDGQWLRLTGAD